MGGWVLWVRWRGVVGICFKTINLRLIDNFNSMYRQTFEFFAVSTKMTDLTFLPMLYVIHKD